jgi:hypothetical protein
MKNLIYVFTILSITLLISCEKEDNQATDKIWPLETGNYWVYVDSSTSSGNWRVDTSKWTMTEPVTIGNKTYYAVSIAHRFSNYENGLKWLYEYSGGDIVSVGAVTLSDTLIAKSVIFKNTKTVNEKWSFYQVTYSDDDGPYVRDTLEMTLKGVGELTHARFGLLKYRMYSYSFNIGEDIRYSELYFADNIGLIKTIIKENGIVISKSELIEYRVN